MLITIKFLTKACESLWLKKINNFIILVLNSGGHCYTQKKFIKKLQHFFTYTFLMYYLRIVWRGKAYRIRFFKKSNKFTFNFGHSHWYKLTYDKQYISFFRLKRQSYLVYFADKMKKLKLEKLFNSIRIYNKYTKRGIRVKKTSYIKRFGKISQVNSVLHSF